MPLTLFYGVPEGCSFGSIVALEWSGVPYNLCRVDMPETVSGIDYKRINPVGETPTLMLPDGRLISESMAILGHIAAKTVGRGLGFEPGPVVRLSGLGVRLGASADHGVKYVGSHRQPPPGNASSGIH